MDNRFRPGPLNLEVVIVIIYYFEIQLAPGTDDGSDKCDGIPMDSLITADLLDAFSARIRPKSEKR